MSDRDLEAINAVRVEATEAFKAGDFERFLTYFTEDAVWMPDGDSAVVGKAAFREWGSHFAEARRPVHFTTSEEVLVDGDLAFDRFTLTTAEEMPDSGTSHAFVLQGLWILRRQDDGSWRICRYIWNSN